MEASPFIETSDPDWEAKFVTCYHSSSAGDLSSNFQFFLARFKCECSLILAGLQIDARRSSSKPTRPKAFRYFPLILFNKCSHVRCFALSLPLCSHPRSLSARRFPVTWIIISISLIWNLCRTPQIVAIPSRPTWHLSWQPHNATSPLQFHVL